VDVESVNVTVAYGRLVLTCRDCDDEVRQYPRPEVPLTDLVSDAEADRHECEPS
jgi:hypothetical protein